MELSERILSLRELFEPVEPDRDAPARGQRRGRDFLGRSGLKGLHEFRMIDRRIAGNPEKRAVVRIDPEAGIVSGDLFADAAKSTWLFSWRSDALYRPKVTPGPGEVRRFAALCAVAFPDRDTHRFAKLLLTATVDGADRGAPRFSGLQLDMVEGNRHLFALDMAEGGHVMSNEALRLLDIRIRYDKALVANRLAHAILLRTLHPKFNTGAQTGISAFEEALETEELDPEIDIQPLQENAFGQATNGAEAIMAIADALAAIPDSADGSFTLFLSSQEEKEGESDVPLGITLGLDQLPSRFGKRRGAIVFPLEIIKGFRKQRGPGLSDPDILGNEDLLEELAYRLKFTMMHELGHLLNLPHPWQRDGFVGVRMAAEPHAPTWMQYGSFFAFGVASDFALQQMNEADREDARSALSGESFKGRDRPLRNARFSDAEKRHIHHAPYDEIAASARTFVDAARAPLVIRAPRGRASPLELEIDGAVPVAGAPGVSEVQLETYTRVANSAKFQPPVGRVRFRLPNGEASDGVTQETVFRFSDRRLVWLIREEFESLWRTNRERRTEGYDAGLPSVLPSLHRPRPNRFEPGSTAGLVAPLPVLLPKFLARSFPLSDRFSLQAVFLAPDGKLHHSNVVRVQYARVGEARPFGPATALVQWILNNSLTPGLVELAEFYDAVALRTLEDDFRGLVTRLRAPELAEAVAAHPARLAWLGTLLRAIEGKDFERTLRIVPGVDLSTFSAAAQQAV